MRLNKDFLLLWQGLLMSTLGVFLYNMLGLLWLVETVGSASLAGLFMLVGVFTAAFTLLAGVVADRYSRRNILVISDMASGITLLTLAALFF